jgi:hypothetical protein
MIGKPRARRSDCQSAGSPSKSSIKSRRPRARAAKARWPGTSTRNLQWVRTSLRGRPLFRDDLPALLNGDDLASVHQPSLGKADEILPFRPWLRREQSLLLFARKRKLDGQCPVCLRWRQRSGATSQEAKERILHLRLGRQTGTGHFWRSKSLLARTTADDLLAPAVQERPDNVITLARSGRPSGRNL